MSRTQQMDQALQKAFDVLKDFQRATVDYAFRQLYENGRSKMLVADEVGLGKTIVAKGLIAKAFQQHLADGPERAFHVIYICSNHALADQNVKKLNLFADEIKPIERLVYLARQPETVENRFRLSSLSPGTSFYLTRGAGEADERRLLFTLLSRYKYFRRHKNGLQYLLIGKVTDPVRWKARTEEYFNDHLGSLQKGIHKRFKQKLLETTLKQRAVRNIFKELDIGREEITLWQAVQRYAKLLWGKNYWEHPGRNTVVGLLRQALTEVCLEYLDADLFILDEFQRYRDLINTDAAPGEESPAIRLARTVFGLEGAKILMLSATPFKPYTNSMDLACGEDHYAEFKAVLNFLMQGKDERFWLDFENDRKAFFRFLRRPAEAAAQLDAAVATRDRLESIYMDAMVRTERVMVSEDRNIMLSNRLTAPFELQAADVTDFICMDKVVREMNKALSNGYAYNPIEYAKSAPFPLSFMDHYQLKEQLRKHKGKKSIQKVLRDNASCWLDLGKVNKYKPLSKTGMPNGKLRCLLQEALYSGASHLLWVPPTVPYYAFAGAYIKMEAFSKVLVFSSWALVPRMIASLVSYEAERLTIGDKKSVGRQERIRNNARTYFQRGKEKRQPRPQLVFSRDGKGRAASNMTNFGLLYPSPTLAKIYHPRQNLSGRQSIGMIRSELKKTIRDLIRQSGIQRFAKEGGETSRWYWAAPILLDRCQAEAKKIVEMWFDLKEITGEATTDPEAVEDTQAEKRSAHDHFLALKTAFLDPEGIGLGKMPDDLADVLVDMVLGSPAICALRALSDYFESEHETINGAAVIAKGFMSLFNKPESIAIVRLSTPSDTYWRQVLQYGINGNIQALLDEFVFLLVECEGYRDSAVKLAEHVSAVMNLRTANIRVDSLKSFLFKDENPTMRCHFALDFGNQIESVSGKKRSVSLREAFNSPFRPFVLATTSIGQEGLDFHYYCRKIMHWNLPANAIDIEQREGRINRYLGHVIRKNVADKYLQELTDPATMFWTRLFALARERERSGDKCDLVPYWHLDCDSGNKIERIVPLHPFSKDIDKLRYLLGVLTFYRLTFGQPRQEELVETFIQTGIDQEVIDTLISKLVINLSPIANTKMVC